MAGEQLTSFEHILLGRICIEPSSGYDLKRVFAATPMGLYQPSSGALYPALHRLELKGMVRAKDSPAEARPSARRRRVLEPTEAGLAAHVAWLRTPVEAETVARDLGLHLMRFAMMERQVPRDEVLRFLGDLADALSEFTAGLEPYAAPTDRGDRHPALAVRHGLAVYRASLEWTRQAVAELGADDHGRGE
jgi:DNA-binding PadR family transcriptional regulator